MSKTNVELVHLKLRLRLDRSYGICTAGLPPRFITVRLGYFHATYGSNFGTKDKHLHPDRKIEVFRYQN